MATRIGASLGSDKFSRTMVDYNDMTLLVGEECVPFKMTFSSTKSYRILTPIIANPRREITYDYIITLETDAVPRVRLLCDFLEMREQPEEEKAVVKKESPPALPSAKQGSTRPQSSTPMDQFGPKFWKPACAIAIESRDGVMLQLSVSLVFILLKMTFRHTLILTRALRAPPALRLQDVNRYNRWYGYNLVDKIEAKHPELFQNLCNGDKEKLYKKVRKCASACTDPGQKDN
jgi:hypothetical protein